PIALQAMDGDEVQRFIAQNQERARVWLYPEEEEQKTNIASRMQYADMARMAVDRVMKNHEHKKEQERKLKHQADAVQEEQDHNNFAYHMAGHHADKTNKHGLPYVLTDIVGQYANLP